MAAVKRHYYTDKTNKAQSLLIRDRQNLTRIFPEEIWNLIFKSYSSSVELHNVAQASKCFEDLLHPLRSQWLFALIWQIITGNLITHNGRRYIHWLKTLLKLRSSCKAWRNAVDRSVENMETNRFVDCAMDWNDEHLKPWFDICLEVRSTTKGNLDQFLTHFEKSHSSAVGRSPFVSQTVSIYDYYEDATNPYSGLPVGKKILSKYGKFVKHCAITCSHIDNLCEFLTLMPNLGTLSIEYSGNTPQKKNVSTEVTLPILSGLKNLKVINLPRIIVNQFVKSSVNLSTFVFIDKEFDINGLLNNPLQKLPALKIFEGILVPRTISKQLLEISPNISAFLTIDEEIDVTGLLKNPLQHLRININLNIYRILKTERYFWPLTTLDLSIEDNCSVEWPDVFALVNQRWSKTLTSLRLELPATTPLDNVSDFFQWSYFPLLRLERLKHLTLNIGNFHALDFILPVRHSLEYLTLHFGTHWDEVTNLYKSEYDNLKRNLKLKLLGHVKENRMIGSNVWALFPKLRQTVFWREGVRVKFYRPSNVTNFDDVDGFCLFYR